MEASAPRLLGSVHGERVGPTGSPGEASFPPPKGGDIPWALLETRSTVRALARHWAKERYGRKLSANRGD